MFLSKCIGSTGVFRYRSWWHKLRSEYTPLHPVLRVMRFLLLSDVVLSKLSLAASMNIIFFSLGQPLGAFVFGKPARSFLKKWLEGRNLRCSKYTIFDNVLLYSPLASQ